MGPIEGKKVFLGGCLSKTVCKSQPDRVVKKGGCIGPICPDFRAIVRVG